MLNIFHFFLCCSIALLLFEDFDDECVIPKKELMEIVDQLGELANDTCPLEDGNTKDIKSLYIEHSYFVLLELRVF